MPQLGYATAALDSPISFATGEEESTETHGGSVTPSKGITKAFILRAQFNHLYPVSAEKCSLVILSAIITAVLESKITGTGYCWSLENIADHSSSKMIHHPRASLSEQCTLT